MKKFYKVTSPLWLPQTKTTGKKFYLNLNVYRNAHHMTLNNMKRAYTERMLPLLKDLPVFENPIILKFVLYPSNKRLCDVDNICSIHAKFFQDALVKAGKIKDDNYLFIKETRHAIGEVDTKNPRVVVYLKELGKD